MPSGHLAAFVGCTVVLHCYFKHAVRKWHVAAWASCAALLCVARVYTGSHFFSQTLVGAVIGAVLSRVWVAVYPVSAFEAWLKDAPFASRSKAEASKFCLVTFAVVGLFLATLPLVGLDPRHAELLASKACLETSWLHYPETVLQNVMKNFGVAFGVALLSALLARQSRNRDEFRGEAPAAAAGESANRPGREKTSATLGGFITLTEEEEDASSQDEDGGGIAEEDARGSEPSLTRWLYPSSWSWQQCRQLCVTTLYMFLKFVVYRVCVHITLWIAGAALPLSPPTSSLLFGTAHVLLLGILL
eukprot:GHVU01111624.1.p1 GENE.GHVU01111624.1~~GHVU01111624.1.p1  ORF type:complete len:303 (+),score=24.59 GHVU01111624.1:827-1735(+)